MRLPLACKNDFRLLISAFKGLLCFGKGALMDSSISWDAPEAFTEPFFVAELTGQKMRHNVCHTFFKPFLFHCFVVRGSVEIYLITGMGLCGCRVSIPNLALQRVGCTAEIEQKMSF